MDQMQLLIIGDEDLFVEALGRLPSATYAVVYAADVEEAEAQVETSPPKMIVVATLPTDERLRALLQNAHRQHGVVRIGLHRDQATEAFDYVIAEAEMSEVLDRIALLARALAAETGGPSSSGQAPTRQRGKTVEQRVSEQGRDLKALEERLAEVALGTTGGLSELLVAMDGVQQALKLHMRLIEGLDHGDAEEAQGEGKPGRAMSQMRNAQRQLDERISALSEQLAPLSDNDPRDPALVAQQLEAQVEHQSHDLKSLEQRIGQVIAGTTGGLTELIEASDGVQQGLKLHERLIGELEARIDNEVMPLRTSVVEMGNQVMGLRRDVRALQQSGSAVFSGELHEDLDEDLDQMLEPLEEDGGSNPQPPAAAKASPPTK